MCTSVIAGKKATADGTILLARNEDFGINNWNKYLKYRVKPQYAGMSAESKWILGNGLAVDVPSVSYRYCSIPDAAGSKEAACGVGDCYYFEERGINECNVAISSTNSMDMNQKAIEADPPVQTGIEEAIILTLLLPQAATAREAIRLLGDYIKKYGASEANGVLIADPEEAWYFEIGSCHHWIAVQIPEDSYLVVSNCMRVHDVDLGDKNVLYSDGLFEFVEKEGLLKEPNRTKFNFARAFGYPGSLVEGAYEPYYNVDRIWLAQRMLSPLHSQDVRKEEYPLFLQPDQKIEIAHIMKVLRADYKGTELEGKATRPIGVVRTTESHIMTIDPNMPEPLKGMIWQTVSTPLGSPYMPLFAVTDHIPECYETGESDYNAASAYWAFRGLFSLLDSCGKSALEELWSRYEKQFIGEYAGIKRMLQRLWKENEEEAVNFAKNYSTGVLCHLAEAANSYMHALLTEISAGQKDK